MAITIDLNKIKKDKIRVVNVDPSSTPSAPNPYTEPSGGGGSSSGNIVNTGGKEDIAPIFANVFSSIRDKMTIDAPVRQQGTQNSGFFQRGAGFGSAKDVTKTILGSGGDVVGNLLTGASSGFEKALLGLAQYAPAFDAGFRNQNSLGPGSSFDIKDYREKQAQNAELIKTGLWDEKAISRNLVEAPLASIGVDTVGHSVFGARSDALAQSGGQLLGSMLINRFIPGAGNAAIFLSAAGGEAQEALNNGASYDDALISSAISGAGELASEKLSGAIKFGDNAVLDDAVDMLGSFVKGRAGRALAKLGIDAAGEGAEEVVSGFISAVGQKLTYLNDQELSEIFSGDDALNAFVDGAIMGSLFGSFDSVKETVRGNDVTTGLSANEQKVVDTTYQKSVEAKKAENGGKINPKDRVELYRQTVNDVGSGVSTMDILEEALGGDAYKQFKSDSDSLAEINAELEALDKADNLSPDDMARYADLKASAQDMAKVIESDKQRTDDAVYKLIKDTPLMKIFGNRNSAKTTAKTVETKKAGEEIPKSDVVLDKNFDEYSDNKQEVIKAYESAVDENILKFIDKHSRGEAWKGEKIQIGTVNDRMASDIEKLTGVSGKTGNQILFNTDAIEHIEKRHGKNGEADQSMTDANDIARINYVLQNYDSCDKGSPATGFRKSDGTKADTIVFQKKINGTYFVVEAVPDGAKTWVVSAYINKNGTSQVPDARSEKAESPKGNVQNEAVSVPDSSVTEKGTNVNGNLSESESGVDVDKFISTVVSDIKLHEEKFSEEYEKVTSELDKQISNVERMDLPEIEKSKRIKEIEQRKQKALKHTSASHGYSVRLDWNSKNSSWAYVIVAPDGKQVHGRAPVDAQGFDEKISSEIKKLVESSERLPVSQNAQIEAAVTDTATSPTIDAPVAEQKQSEITAPVADLQTPRKYRIANGRESETQQKKAITEALVRSDVSYDPAKARKWVKPYESAKYAKPSSDNSTVEAPSDRLAVDSDPVNGKYTFFDIFKEYFVDKGSAVEKVARKHNNRELEGKYHSIRNVRAAAQRLITEGNPAAGIKSLREVYDAVTYNGTIGDFSEYLIHARNMDAMSLTPRMGIENRGILGNTSYAESHAAVEYYEKKHPEFEKLAKELYAYNWNLLQRMVDSRLVSQEQMDVMRKMYPHYIPIRRLLADDADIRTDVAKVGVGVDVNRPLKRVVGGKQDVEDLFITMANRTLAVEHAAAMNKFALEYYKTIHPDRADFLDFPSGASKYNAFKIFDSDDIEDGFIKGGNNPTLGMYVDGDRLSFNIGKDVYGALKPMDDLLSSKIPVLSNFSDFRRRAITAWNPVFAIKNAFRDATEVLKNSQHPLETYMNFPKAISELHSKGEYYQERAAAGGSDVDIAYDFNKQEFDPKKGVMDWLEGRIGLKQIVAANNFIEQIPRMAEYIASREAGRSVDVSMMDADRVTVDFGAGGAATKFADRNGFTFLNASVQGARQHIRNIQEAKQKGVKACIGLAARYMLNGLGAMALNDLIWGDDEDYANLPDYIVDDYYIVGKYGDGQFVRIPKGRTDAVMENALMQVSNALTGNDEVDFERFWKLFIDNMAPNNPFEDHIFAPIQQVVKNEAWHGSPIVSERLQKLPTTEQFDEKTDEASIAISRWLNEKLDYEVSPKKINYLLDNYSGVFGDMILPFVTPKASSASDNPIAPLFAPWRNTFSVDSVFNDRSQGDYYDTLGELGDRAEAAGATDEDILLNEYMGSYNYELGNLYAEMREIQMSDLPNSEKYARAKEIKKKINDIQHKAMQGYNDIMSGNGRFNIDGLYAEVGEKRFDYSNKDQKWYSIGPSDDEGVNSFYENEQAITNAYGISYSEYWNNKEKWDDIYRFAGRYRTDPSHIPNRAIDVIFGVDNYAQYASAINDMEATPDGNGGYISGSKWKQVKAYIDNLDIPDMEKKILKKIYHGEGDYGYDNYAIIRWLDQNPDISDADFWKIAEELGYMWDENGHITWEAGKK